MVIFRAQGGQSEQADLARVGRPWKDTTVLVLTRRKNQSIVIGDDIIVTVLEVKGDQIRLGITAPREVQVYREELLTGGKQP
ncbi:MAG: Carbon storage regulator [Frankiales bacterium]|nr:Carbon storage regulator [Frankiales bacterium]